MMSTLVAVLSLCTVYLFPTARMKAHVLRSSGIQVQEKNYPNQLWGPGSQLDGYTDSIMLREAIYDGSESIIFKAMSVPRKEFDWEKIQQDNSSLNLLPRPVKELIADAKNIPSQSVTTYSRYWHGYLVLLKPLLCVLNYGQIRLLNMILQIFLFSLLLYFMVLQQRQYIPAFILAFCFLTPVIFPMSLQFSAVYYIMLMEMILLLKNCMSLNHPKIKYFFFCGGMATCFFDLLTYPLVSLGIPLTLSLNLTPQNTFTDENPVTKIMKCCVSWGFGYGAFWFCKWLTASVLLKENVFSDAFHSAVYRSSTVTAVREGGAAFSVIDVLVKNIKAFGAVYYVFLFAAILLVIYKFYQIAKSGEKIPNRVNLLLGAAYLFVFSLPFIWYMVFSNHSYVHFWFTSRALAVSVFALFSFFTRMIEDASASENRHSPIK